MWLSASEALARLGSKPQSLYASVSRGRIRAKPDPADSRRSLYNAEDVERLAARARGRRSSAAVAADAISWGEPVLASAIATIAAGRLLYRGQDAAALAAVRTLEEVAALLWDGACVLPAGLGVAASDEPKLAAFTALAARAARDGASAGQGVAALRLAAGGVLGTLADAMLGSGDGPLHERLAERLGRPAAADLLRRALVLLADHELNASTFAARVTVSTGASLAAGTLAGLAALGGPLHGDAAATVAALAGDVGGAIRPTEALRDWLGEGRTIPGFGHRLYPLGDSRSAALLAQFEEPPDFRRLRTAAEALSGERPNVDFALAAMSATYGLPRYAPFVIFALARCVGWLAHVMEQATTGQLIRPRARYSGPTPALSVLQKELQRQQAV